MPSLSELRVPTYCAMAICALGILTPPAHADFVQQGNKLVGTGVTTPLGEGARQGTSVSISADGNTVLSGGPSDGSSKGIGASWIFTRSNGVWTQQGPKLVGSGADGQFIFQGNAVALSGDGNTALIGGYEDGSDQAENNPIGAAWVFVRNNGVWSQQGSKLTATGDVGFAQVGYSVALSYDGNTALIGAPADSLSAGATFVFVRNGGAWSQQAKLFGSNPVGNGSRQGSAVALSADGNTALIGGPGDDSSKGAAWVFTRTNGVWTQQGQKMGGGGGCSSTFSVGRFVALSADGNTAALANDSGCGVLVHVRNNGVWTHQASVLAGGSNPGSRVGLSSNGNVLVTGSQGDSGGVGAIFAFTRLNGAWTQLGQKFRGSGFQGPTPNQGRSVAISGNGGTMVEGGPFDGANDNVGAVWVFTSPVTAAHDFNGVDGKSDILWRDTSGNAAIWFMDAARVVGSPGLGNIPTAWSIVGQRDLNGDGKHDILWRHSGGTLAAWFMSSGNVLSSATIASVPTNWLVAGTGDLNGDGKGDIVWRDTSGQTAVWLMNGAAVTASGALGNVPTTWTLLATADFNGDGKADLLWRFTDGTVVIWFMNGTAVTSTAVVANVPTTWNIVGTGDFDGNGKADILWRNTSGNASVWLMSGAAIAATGNLPTIPTSWSLIQTGDYNGDGRSDLLWRFSDGTVVIWFMNGANIAFTATVGNVPTTWAIQNVNVN
jgi:hypothetical protein